MKKIFIATISIVSILGVVVLLNSYSHENLMAKSSSKYCKDGTNNAAKDKAEGAKFGLSDLTITTCAHCHSLKCVTKHKDSDWYGRVKEQLTKSGAPKISKSKKKKIAKELKKKIGG